MAQSYDSKPIYVLPFPGAAQGEKTFHHRHLLRRWWQQLHNAAKNRFPPETPDDEWLSVVGAKGWIAFSHDRKWHHEQPVLSAIKQHKIGCFYLWGAECLTWDKLCFFVQHWQKIVELAQSTPKPFVYYVNKRGQFEKVNLDEIKQGEPPAKISIRAVR